MNVAGREGSLNLDTQRKSEEPVPRWCTLIPCGLGAWRGRASKAAWCGRVGVPSPKPLGHPAYLARSGRSPPAEGLIPADPAVYARLPKVHSDESRTQGLDRLELIRFLQVAQTITVHHGALAYLLGINALGASEAASVRIEDYAETMRGHRVLHLVGKGDKPATMPLTVPVLRVLEACRGERTTGPLILRPKSGRPIDRRDAYRMVVRVVKAAGILRHISPHSLRHAAITNALDAGVPLRDAQILARHADPRTTEHYDRARGNLDRHGVHFLTACIAGV